MQAAVKITRSKAQLNVLLSPQHPGPRQQIAIVLAPRLRASLFLIKRLDTNKDLLQEALEKCANIAAHSNGIGLVEGVNILADMCQSENKLPNLIMPLFGALLPRGNGMFGRGTVDDGGKNLLQP